MTTPSVEYELPRQLDSPRAARSLLLPFQEHLGPRHEDVVLLVSELVANAVAHGDGDSVKLALTPGEARFRVEVMDSGSGFEVPPAQPDPTAAGGRGLMLVDAIADAWGAFRENSTHVWFEIRLQTA